MRKMVVHAPAYLQPDKEIFESHFEEYKGWEVIIVNKPEQLSEVIEEAEILVTHPCPKEIVLKGNKLKWLQALSVGVDAFPLAELRQRGVIITNGKGIHRIHMAEYAIAAMIMLARSVHLMMRNQTQNRWYRKIPQGEINGATLGILGLGTIGQEVAKKASFMGMKVLGIKKHPAPLPHVDQVKGMDQLGWLFSECDYIINLLPGTSETKDLVDKDLMSKMKKSACLINMGRGTTIKEADLITFLQEGGLRAFWSDVFEEEPLPESSPLWQMDNVVITPHICGESIRYLDKAMEIIKHNVKVYQSGTGKMINLVDPDKGY